MDEVRLTRKIFKNNELRDNLTRQAKYFNSDIVMLKDQGKWQELNSKLLNQGRTQCSGVFRTHKVLLCGLLFCRH